jgi:transcriptional regulator with GAF, ATPase, and Fis domain
VRTGCPPSEHRLREAILRALEQHAGNKSAAARSIGRSRNGLQKAIRRLGLDGR